MPHEGLPGGRQLPAVALVRAFLLANALDGRTALWRGSCSTPRLFEANGLELAMWTSRGFT